MKKQLKNRKNKVTSTGLVMLIFVILMGCAGTGKMSPFQMDEMLVRAGFQLHTADTAKKLDFLKSLPQNELVHKTYNEKVSYFYVDGSSCKCMYVGDEQAYQRFRQSVKEEQMNEKIETTQMIRSLGFFFPDTARTWKAKRLKLDIKLHIQTRVQRVEGWL